MFNIIAIIHIPQPSLSKLVINGFVSTLYTLPVVHLGQVSFNFIDRFIKDKII